MESHAQVCFKTSSVRSRVALASLRWVEVITLPTYRLVQYHRRMKVREACWCMPAYWEPWVSLTWECSYQTLSTHRIQAEFLHLRVPTEEETVQVEEVSHGQPLFFLEREARLRVSVLLPSIWAKDPPTRIQTMTGR